MGKYCIKFYLYELHRIANRTETESKIEVTRGSVVGGGEMGNSMLNGYGALERW